MPKEDDTDTKVPDMNILGDALDKFYAEQDAGLAGLQNQQDDPPPADDKEPKKEPDVKPPPPAEDDDESEIDNIKVDDIRTRAGLPISENAKEKFKKLETSRNKWKAKVAEHEAKLKEFEAKMNEQQKSAAAIAETDEYKRLLEENQKLKEAQDILFFEQSDDWKNTFEKPLATVSQKIEGLIQAALPLINGSHKQELAHALGRASALLGDPSKEVEYDSIVDGITENLLTGSSGTKLARLMQEAWLLAQQRAEAKANKAAAREKITLQQRATREKTKSSLEELMKLQEAAFEQSPVGQIVAQKMAEKYDYGRNKEIGRKMLDEALDIFIKTGEPTPELTKFLHHASLMKVHEKEREYLVSSYNNLIDIAQQQDQKIKELEKRISELRGGIGDPAKSDKQAPKTVTKKGQPYSIVDDLDKAIAGFSR